MLRGVRRTGVETKEKTEEGRQKETEQSQRGTKMVFYSLGKRKVR